MDFWHFRELDPNDNSGASTVDDNFANEERTSTEILVRETLQNPLDARRADELVQVRYDLVSLNVSTSAVLKSLFSSNCLQHFVAGGILRTEAMPETVEFLVVEDFGTTGLEGCFVDSTVDGPEENWNAFWFREGEGAKPSRANGGAGQGKITLYAASEMRSVLALTYRASDKQQLVFGTCRFRRNYKLDGNKARWAKEARWGHMNDAGLTLPISDASLVKAMKSELGLMRGDRPGTSFIVPMPTGTKLGDIKTAVLNEFFFPIRRGRLEVFVGDTRIDRHSVAALAAKLGNAARYDVDFRKFLEDAAEAQVDGAPLAEAKTSWSQNSKLTDDLFEVAQLRKLKESFEASEIVSVDFPVRIRKKNAVPMLGKFRVVLKQNLDGEQSQELFVRQDLCIDGEKKLKGSRRIQPVHALTFVNDFELSGFLVAAEEPTHRTWNANRPKVQALYDGTGSLLNAVRNAALRLVELLTPPGVRDTTALSLYFAAPQSDAGKLRGANGAKANTQNADKKDPPNIPPARPRPIELQALKDGFMVRALSVEAVTTGFPLVCSVSAAYATTLGDPFKQWDAADFWLNSEKEHPITEIGVSEICRDGNEIRFKLDTSESVMKIVGFDSNRKLEVKLNYHESKNAEDLQDN